MGRCHVFLSFLYFLFYYRSHVLIHLFFSEVCSRYSSLFGKTFSSRWTPTSKVDHEKWQNYFPMGFACFPIEQTQGSACSFSVAIVNLSHVFLSACPFLHPPRRPQSINLQVIQLDCACLSHMFTLFVVDLHVISWHFVLTWPLSLSLSRSGVEELHSRHRFLRSGGGGGGDDVGVSGPDVDGD